MRRLLLLVSCLIAGGCSDNVSPPQRLTPPSMPHLTIAQLLAAPESLEIDSVTVPVDVFLNRDFQPASPPNGRPMDAFAQLYGSPSGNLPVPVTDVYLWVFRAPSDVWPTPMEFLGVDWSRSAHSYTAHDGPLWSPGTAVDVILGARTSPDDVQLVRVRDVVIARSE